MTKYCRKIGQTEIYIQTPYLMARKDMEVCDGPKKESKVVETTQEMVIEKPRTQIISEVISTIDPETYSKPAGGRPAMPKVSVVSEKAGFKVTSTEIIEAMEP